MHAPFLKVRPELYDVVVVLERHKEESKILFPKSAIVRSMNELLQHDVELVIITTPNDSHFSYSKAAMLAGRHVVVDKPFTITSSEALELIELNRQTKKVLSVFQNRRYVTDYLTIQELLQKNLLGRLHTYEANYNRYRPEAIANAWRETAEPGSGVLYDLGPHLIDQCLCFFGLPKNIFADIRTQRSHVKADDYFELQLDYGFLKATLKAGMLVRENGPRYVLHGTAGSFIKYGEDPQEVYLRAGKLPTEVANWGIEDESIWGTLHTEKAGSVIKEKFPSLPADFGGYYENLFRTIRENAPLQEKPEHSYNNICLIEMAFESSKQKSWIECNGLMPMS